MTKWVMQKEWPLGLIGLVGIWKVPEIWAFLTGASGSWWDFANLLWFLWFLYFLPEETDVADTRRGSDVPDVWDMAWDDEDDA